MVKMRRADYHPLEIVVKAVFILLIVRETSGDSKQDSYESTVQKNISPLRSKAIPNYDTDSGYYPLWYYLPSSQKIQPYKEESRDRIVFPQEDFVPLRFEDDNWIKNPPVCKGTTFCEDIPYYPTELVTRTLLKNESLKNLAFSDTIEGIRQRIDLDSEEPLCLSNEQVIYPTSGETSEGSWLFIAQLKQQNFTQGVRIEKCLAESKPCRVIDGFAAKYETKCKQRYVYRQLVAVTADGVDEKLFRFPSSCCCAVAFKGRTKRRSLFLKNAEDAV